MQNSDDKLYADYMSNGSKRRREECISRYALIGTLLVSCLA